jgi:hypothetical protein
MAPCPLGSNFSSIKFGAFLSFANLPPELNDLLIEAWMFLDVYRIRTDWAYHCSSCNGYKDSLPLYPLPGGAGAKRITTTLINHCVEARNKLVALPSQFLKKVVIWIRCTVHETCSPGAAGGQRKLYYMFYYQDENNDLFVL